MSRTVTRSFLIVCDRCEEEFMNGLTDGGTDTLAQYRAAARKAGWYSGVNNLDFCPDCVDAMQKRRNKSTA